MKYRKIGTSSVVAALALVVAGTARVFAAQRALVLDLAGATNEHFVITRDNTVFAFDTATKSIGPFRSSIAQGSHGIRWTQPIVLAGGIKSISLHVQITHAAI